MRIIIITQDDTFYIKKFFKVFLERCPENIQIQAAVVCRTMGKSRMRLARQLFDFYGPVDFTRMALRHVANLLLAATVGSLGRRWPINLQQVFRAYDVEVIHTTNVNSKKLREQLRTKEPDLVVSVAAPQIIKKRLLELPRLGCINIHTARLPQYRGMMPNFWAMYHDEKLSAITIHTMDAEIDRGHMILQKEFELRPQDSLDRLIKRTKQLGAECMIEALQIIDEKGIQPIDPPDLEASYFSFPTKEQVKTFRRRGKRLL